MNPSDSPRSPRVRRSYALLPRSTHRLMRRVTDVATPPRMFVGSFLLLILLGTIALKWLPGVNAQEPLGWLDALFTATSAVCVTGLIVTDTATQFTTFGQVIILILIQLGGIGMISFASFIIIALGRRLTLRVEQVSGIAGASPTLSPKRLIRGVLLYTGSIELVAFLALWWAWADDFPPGTAAWHALFHSVSAFCNAGFSTFSDSLVGANHKPAVLLIVSVTIIFGSAGYIVLQDVVEVIKQRMRGLKRRVSLYTLLVFWSNLALLLLGFVLLTWFEWTGELGELRWSDRFANGWFMSVTTRTAGFNSIDYAAAGSGTNFLTVLLMFVGGAPGSTAGGIKVTTFAVIALLAWNRLRGRRVVTLAGRSIPDDTILRAVGLVVLSATLLVMALLCFTRTEFLGNEDVLFLDYLFEAVSAFCTVGLSMGVTDDLSAAGRWMVIGLMFVGRVGPLTFGAALARSLRQKDLFRYAYQDVTIG